MSKKYILKLTSEEKATLERLIGSGKAARWKVQRAQALLKCNEQSGEPSWPDRQIAEAFGCTARSIENWRRQAVEEGPLSLLERQPQKARATKLDGEKEAKLTQLACSKAPAGYGRWSLRLLAERVVELEMVDSISHETIRRTLKKAR